MSKPCQLLNSLLRNHLRIELTPLRNTEDGPGARQLVLQEKSAIRDLKFQEHRIVSLDQNLDLLWIKRKILGNWTTFITTPLPCRRERKSVPQSPARGQGSLSVMIHLVPN